MDAKIQAVVQGLMFIAFIHWAYWAFFDKDYFKEMDPAAFDGEPLESTKKAA